MFNNDEKPVPLIDLALEHFRKAGLKPNGKLTAISSVIAAGLSEKGAKPEIERLQAFGLRLETLAVAVMFLKFAPAIDATLRPMFGDARQKKRKAKILYEAVEVLTGIDKYFAGLDTGLPHEFVEDHGFPRPSTTAYALTIYANMLLIREQVLRALDANSGHEIARYTLASAVHRVTGKYHDREVSAVIWAAEGTESYDETNHRVWRIRTYPRLNRTISALPVFLQAMNSVLNEPPGS